MTIRRGLLAGGFCVLSCTIIALMSSFVQNGKCDFQRLLDGDPDISVAAAEFETDKERFSVDDSLSTEYLSKALRLANKGSGELGITLYLNLRLSTGAVVKCAVYLPENPDKLTIHFPIDNFDDGTMYSIPMQRPLPETLARLLGKLR